MTGSTARSHRRFTALWLSGLAMLLVATGCSSDTSAAGDPSISVSDDRGSGDKLEKLTVEGDGYTSNGTVLVTVLMSAIGGNVNPYVEEEVQADGEGSFTYERQPVPCPQPVDYDRGSFISVIARDMTSGISASRSLEPGGEPDCTR